jgi:hypothetical protein
LVIVDLLGASNVQVCLGVSRGRLLVGLHGDGWPIIQWPDRRRVQHGKM